jgi:hypothetical protein
MVWKVEAVLNAHAQPATPTPTGDDGARVTVPPGNAVIGDGSVGWLGVRVDGWLVVQPAVRSDGLESLKAELNAPVQHTMPTPMGNADARVTVPPRNAVNGGGLNAHTPCMLWMEDELRTNNLLLQIFTGADPKLQHGIFGDTIHHNDDLNGGIGDDKDRKWQRLHKRIVAARLPLYSLPNSWWAKQFLALKTTLWRDVRLQGCNLEKACIFCTAHPSSGPIEKNDERGEDAGLVPHGCMGSQSLLHIGERGGGMCHGRWLSPCPS